MQTPASDNAQHRVVVLLRTKEKKRLQTLATQENVSSSEIVRRCIQAYQSSSRSEQEDFQSLLSEMNHSLDKALEQVRADRAEIAENLAQIRQRSAHPA